REGETLRVGEEGIQISFDEAGKLSKDDVFLRWEKMSKSKGNVVTPDEAVERYGADGLRVYELFEAPFEATIQWSDERVHGATRFLNRVFRLTDQIRPHLKKDWRERIGSASLDDASEALRRATHTAIERVSKDIEGFEFNTAVAAMMEFVNAINEFVRDTDLSAEGAALVASEAAETLVLLLAPIAPHSADEIWESYGFEGFTYRQPWPSPDPALLKSETVTIVLQVNGKTRGTMEARAATSEKELERLALSHERVQAHMEGKTLRKVIVVPGRLVNVVAD
ncbi:MAG: class I tRNA ligase family protein, partial [Armatimonadetes bacterium]|nr:class I tRNA ligase family protein [Armatimonadota bacterium]